MPTGGFGVDPRSVEPYAPASQWVLALFMAIAGANFALLYRAIVRRKPIALARDEEFRLYIGLLLLASAALADPLGLGDQLGEEAIRQAVFQTVSIMTTTGFASTDFATWVVAAPAAAMLIVALMFPGGSAGSTAGSIKVVRHLVIGRLLRRELDQAMHPEYVAPIRVNRVAIDERTVRAVIAFVLLYVGIFVVGAVLLLLDAHRVDLEPDAVRRARSLGDDAGQRRAGVRVRRADGIVRAVQRRLDRHHDRPDVDRPARDRPGRRAPHEGVLAGLTRWFRSRHPAQLIVFAFAVGILVGAALLLLPFATESGERASFLTAIFTSTSRSA